MEDDEPVVAVRNAYKRYSPKNVILAGLNMTIERGTIYGLLGPSGCGKSTLLSCIVGRLDLDAGTVKVDFDDRLQIGYMPQDLALNMELTIEELLTFYGRIYRLSWERINQRMQELMTLLELPPKDRQVRNCSGGQQRRISMAITLIHDPELLIMDEPTVGIDPLLCASIWECFFELVKKKNKTIVITTHYIEEAKSADRIGLMRNGVLLAENSPQMLMERFDCDSLEDVFLHLSKTQEGESGVTVKDYPAKQKQSPIFYQKQSFNKVRFLAQLKKNWAWTLRNLGVTLFVLFMPTLCLSIVCTSDIENIVTVPIGVVVPEDHSCPSNATPIRPCLTIPDFTCRYIEILESIYPVLKYHSYDEAREVAIKGNLAGILYFHENFTEGVMERLEKQSATSSKALEEGTMYTAMDMSSFPVAHIMVYRVYRSLEKLLNELCNECNFDTRLAHIPLDIPIAVHGGRHWKFQDSFLPSTVLPFVFYTMFIYSSSSLAMEITSGLLERYQTAGLTINEILAAQSLLQMLVINVQNIFMFVVIYGFCGAIMVGSYLTCYMIVVVSELFGMAFGVLIAIIVKKETLVSMVGVGLQFVAFTYCGCLWPKEGQHQIVQVMGMTFPLTPVSISYFNVSLRGWSLTKYEVYMNVIQGALGTLGIAIIIALLLWSKLLNI
ncbi:hypothetical protein GE061_013721 [Apolygus lucorum]|uniref:Uncharacterized protein n=1 Tax=Apolygus lucorum TaxID=248454 RepID=A0A6A4K332_APOLU|nr:hypothetical protein GE061_013721 [Apolygus lucorum]